MDGNAGAFQYGQVRLAVDNDVPDGLELGQQLGEAVEQGAVHDHHAVFGMVRHVGELIRKQPDIDRVKYRTHRRYAEVRHHVLGVVPHECADALPLPHTEVGERVGQPGRIRADLSVGRGTHTVRRCGDDPARGEHAAAVVEHPANLERDVHHRADQQRLPGVLDTQVVGVDHHAPTS